jgi:hypothetical protein
MFTVRGLLDTAVAYDGFYIPGVALGLPTTQAAFGYESDLNGCSGFDSVVTPVPGMDLNGTEGTMTVQTTTGCNATVKLLTLNTAGHQTLNNAPEVFPRGAANTTLDITSMLWDFCGSFVSADEPDLGEAIIIEATAAPIVPSTVAPVTPAPVSPAPVTPAPVTPAPVTPAPVTPAPVTPAPLTPAPVTPPPATAVPITQAPVTPAPVEAPSAAPSLSQGGSGGKGGMGMSKSMGMMNRALREEGVENGRRGR